MTYELLKQLKDAGFPQNNHYYCREDGIISDVCIPTLSKLIEACGDRFEYVRRCEDGEFVAGTYIEAKPLEKGGSTPEEAVIKLWLEINKK